MNTVAPVPTPSLTAIRGALAALAAKARAPVRPSTLDARDPHFIDRVRPLLDLSYDRYFRCETELTTALPRGAFLAVANHNGMTGTPDMFCLMAAFWRIEGTRRPAYGLMHDVPFNVPAAGAWLNACGALSARVANAELALRGGAALLVFPGGDLDACKAHRDRYTIGFGKRRGFIRLAIRAQIPIVPIVSVGGHDSLYIWSDGQRFARAIGLPSLARSNVAPLGLALPFGLVAGIPYPHLPPPVKIHTRFLEPIDLGLPASAEHDEATVEAAHDRVVVAMQAAMDELRRAGRHGLFPAR